MSTVHNEHMAVLLDIGISLNARRSASLASRNGWDKIFSSCCHSLFISFSALFARLRRSIWQSLRREAITQVLCSMAWFSKTLIILEMEASMQNSFATEPSRAAPCFLQLLIHGPRLVQLCCRWALKAQHYRLHCLHTWGSNRMEQVVLEYKIQDGGESACNLKHIQAFSGLTETTLGISRSILKVQYRLRNGHPSMWSAYRTLESGSSTTLPSRRLLLRHTQTIRSAWSGLLNLTRLLTLGSSVYFRQHTTIGKVFSLVILTETLTAYSPNGMRPELMTVLKNLNPSYLRCPGGNNL